jgi:hypothetical protein
MRDRTADLLRARQALSQLSYSPGISRYLVGLGGFEPPTSPLSGVRSNQLSYRPKLSGLPTLSIASQQPVRQRQVCGHLAPDRHIV